MSVIYHLVTRETWEAAEPGPYRAESLATEGFIHCSHSHQVAWAANRFYGQQENLLVLCIDSARLTSPLREEAVDSGEMFPHIYGPVDRSAVVEVRPLQRGDGQWIFP
jgi:uncharacterized protein (DUF952 family)